MTNIVEHLVHRHSVDAPDKIAVIHGENQYSYSELDSCINQCSKWLLDNNLQQGDRVVLVLPNAPEYIVAFLAVVNIGAIVVPADPGHKADRLGFIVEETSPRWLIYADQRPPIVVDAVSSVRLSFAPDTGTIVFSNSHRVANEPKSLTAPSERCAAIIYSSGSTGRPKGVVLTHDHLLTTANNLANMLTADSNHRDLILSPMNHTDGWQRVASALYAGASLIIYEGLLSIAGWLDDVQRFKISSFYTPPPFLNYLLKADRSDIKEMTTTLRSIEIGSAPVSPDRIHQLSELFPGVTIYVHFGLTESSRATILNATIRPDKRHTVGTACKNVEISIRDDQGKIRTHSSQGEILLRGMQSTRYYWQRDDLNQQRFLDDWLLTGDYGELDSDGYLLFRGRKDDMINFSGFHYFPAEAELELKQVPGVAQYVFCGVPDEQGIHQHLPCAFFQPEPDAQAADAGRTLLTLSRQNLLPHMVPRKVIPVTDIPLTSSGKPNRRQLIKDYLYQIDEQLK